jgi:two-component system nitrate/nitrite response regulator NarL
MRVLLIDDHALVRKGLEQLLVSRGVEVVASVGSGREGIEQALALRPDIILLDVKMPQMSGTETLKHLRDRGVTAPILMLTMSREEEDLQAALRNGATGYLLKDMDHEELVPALQDALRGNNVIAKELIGSLTRLVQGQTTKPANQPASADLFSGLTPRELEILRHLAEGQSNKEIGRALDISDGTVKLHVKAILRKLGIRSRVEAAVLAVEHGLGRRGGTAPPDEKKEKIS